MDRTGSFTTVFDESEVNFIPSSDWWFELLRTSACVPFTSDNLADPEDPSVARAMHMYLGSLESSNNSSESPGSSSNTTYPSPQLIPYGYNVSTQQQHLPNSKACSHPTPSQLRADKRRHQNRMAQRAYRDRKEQRLRELEDELVRCKTEYDQLAQSCETQQKIMQTLERQRLKLASCIAGLKHYTAKSGLVEETAQLVGSTGSFLGGGGGGGAGGGKGST